MLALLSNIQISPSLGTDASAGCPANCAGGEIIFFILFIISFDFCRNRAIFNAIGMD
jgi:hypothetical protein